MHKIKTTQFEGPLDLLLQLIEEKRLNITDVALADVTEEYLRILQNVTEGEVPAHELADFLVVAARLLLIKSRALLPFLQWEDEETEELSRQLRMYKEYADAAKLIQKLMHKNHRSFSREKLLVTEDVGFQPPQKATASRLRDVFAEVIGALTPVLNLKTDLVRRSISLQEKIEHIRSTILKKATANFSELVSAAKDRTEVIVSFLAVLELIKQQAIIVRQHDAFSDIHIERASAR